MIRHHPDDSMLLAHAAGTLAPGPGLMMATHLEACDRCRRTVRRFESVGAELMSRESGAALHQDALARTLARLDDTPPAFPAPVVRPRPGLPPGMEWPRSLRHCRISSWRLIGPGMRWSRVRLPHDARVHLTLLRIAAGKRLPPHSHDGVEITQVLHGAFDDGRAVFAAGDFDATDASIRHQPVVQAGGECICLALVDGRLAFDGGVARWLGALIGM